MAASSIPPNDPKAPRWLLDLEKWRIVPFTEIPRDILDTEGYGIVSYTWGYIADWTRPATDVPEGVSWVVPSTTKWPLSKARSVMAKLECRYMWWDWMCVPQGRDLPPELSEAQGQEIGKQLHIYQGAKHSIVWLHSTEWKKNPALKSLLLLPHPYTVPKDLETIMKYLEDSRTYLAAAQKDERWLISGWTLQEGVLLGQTRLIDGDGEVLRDEKFASEAVVAHVGESGKEVLFDERFDPKAGNAHVEDLTNTISSLARYLGDVYFIHTEGYDPNPSRPASRNFVDALPNTPESNLQLQSQVKSLVATGLVGYDKFSPLTILAGKATREFTKPHDKYWALLGALELENVPVSYQIPLQEAREIFLVALFEKYQWMMLFLPYLDLKAWDTREPRVWKSNFKWTDICDGVLMPLMFSIEGKSDPEMIEADLSVLSYSQDKLTITGREGKRFRMSRLWNISCTWFRHYRQDDKGLRIVSPRTTALQDYIEPRGAYIMPLWLVDVKDGVQGRRCLLLLRHKTQPPTFIPSRAVFGGIIDIFAHRLEDWSLEKLELDPS